MFTSIVALTLFFLSLSCFTTASPPHATARSGSKIEALTRAGHRLSYLLDTKNYTALDTVLAQDVVLDVTDLLPLIGGETNGFDETVNVFKRSGAGAKTAHRITNVLLLEETEERKARVSS